MRRTLRVGLASVLLGAGMVGAGGTAQAAPAETVEVLGGITIQPGQSLTVDFRFQARDITVNSGDQVKWVNSADVRAPHTITLVRESKLPQTFADLNACYGPGEPCSRALRKHGNKKNRKLVVEDDADNERGLDEPRDSRWLKAAPGSSFTANISAPAGETLFYLCAIHPWMQGSITVQ